jgi:cytoskeletal protein CcmA (bactofilin family)
MFGRRNPDRPLDGQTRPLKGDLDLDMLDDLPDIEAAESSAPPAPAASPFQQEQQPEDLAWQSATPTLLGPSVTQLLQKAEAMPTLPAGEPAPAYEAAPAYEPAPAYEAAPAYEPVYSSYMAEASPAPEPAPTYSYAPPPSTPAPEPAYVEASVSEPAPVAPPPTPPAPALAPAAPAARPRTIAESVIGPDDFFDGRYRSERGVRIQGNARGSIESRQYIYVEAGAQVEADLSAEEITVAGDFTGKITCRGRLEVTGTGKIQGHVETALLVVQEGGSIDGELSMRKSTELAAGK